MTKYQFLYDNLTKFAPEIDNAVAGKNLLSVFEDNVNNHPNLPALFYASDKEYQQWRSINWREYRDQALHVASGLLELNVPKDEVVLILSRNRPEHNIIDLGIVYANAIPCSLYQTLKANQIVDILAITKSSILFCDTEEMAREAIKAQANHPCLKHIIMLSEPPEDLISKVQTWQDFINHASKNLTSHMPFLSKRHISIKPSDVACVLFTSGTTGRPKGVCITHHNILWTVQSYLETTDIIKPHPRMISYLPMAHITERVAHHYQIICRVGSLHFAYGMKDLKQVLPVARPTLFFAVPRIWEKFYQGLMLKINNSGKKALVMSAINNGLKRVDYIQQGKKVPLWIRIKHYIYTKLIFKKMLYAIGVDQTEIFGTGAAPMRPEIARFFHAINIDVTEVYGLTENTAPALSNLPNNPYSRYFADLRSRDVSLPVNTNKIGSVGIPIPGISIRLDEDGELLMKGHFIFKGYYHNDRATAASFTEDGWFKTGDIASIDDEGFVHIIGRKKEIIVTSGGKNIAPVEIENYILKSPLIGNVCVIGDNRHYLTALITLNHEGGCETWAKEHQLSALSSRELVEHPDLIAAVDILVQKANERLSRVQQIKKFTVLPDPWLPETLELTPTLKLKRFYIAEKYQAQIDAMYTDEDDEHDHH